MPLEKEQGLEQAERLRIQEAFGKSRVIPSGDFSCQPGFWAHTGFSPPVF